MIRTRTWLVLALVIVLGGSATWWLRSQESSAVHPHEMRSAPGLSITNNAVTWPTFEEIRRVVLLRDYNTRVVFAGVTVLGAAGGLVGTFLLLRKRSLLSDTVSHSTLPGIASAFMVAEALGQSGRSLPLLLAGGALSGVLGMMAVAFIRAHSRIKDDAALAIVLSVFFGGGMALIALVQQMPTGNAAGLTRYIYGKAAAMTLADAQFILLASLGVALVCVLLFKELKLLCFDADFARAQGWPVLALDFTLMGLVVAVTVIGLQAVGLLLVVALLIVPPAAARFWTHRLGVTMILAAVIGACSGLVGVALSALFPKLPAGAVIVLAAVACFALSFGFGVKRGLLVRWIEHRRVASRVARQHLLRAIYEWCEVHATTDTPEAELLDQSVALDSLAAANHWSRNRLRTLLRLGQREGLISVFPRYGNLRLTAEGRLQARRVTRNHRRWEAYLLHYADVAPQHIHHNADQIEHVIDPMVVNELEELLAGRFGGAAVPANPEPGGTSPARGGARA